MNLFARGKEHIQYIDLDDIGGISDDCLKDDGILRGGLAKSRIIIHDPEAVSAQSTVRPRGSWGRAKQKIKNSLSMRSNLQAQSPTKRSWALSTSEKKSVQTSTSEQFD